MSVASSIVDLLFPTRCVVCGALHRDPLCPSCVAALPYIDGPICARCGAESSSSEPPPAYSRCRSLFVFEDAGREVIHVFKYANGRRLAPVFASAAVERIEPEFFDVDCVTYVPLHPSRRSQRGYNQSQLIARCVGRLIGAPVVSVLRQARPTADQSRLSGEERRRNIKGAFECRRLGQPESGRHPADLHEMRVLLVDDVFTTGATAGECASVLVQAGAAEVRVLTIARAPFD